MKKEVKIKAQNKVKNSDIEIPEETIISSEENVNQKLEIEVDDIFEIAEILEVDDFSSIYDAENKDDDFDNVLATLDEAPPFNTEKKVKSTEPKPVTENSDSANKQKIKAIKRAIENKAFSIEREEIKVKDWRIQATDRDKLAKEEYEKKKSELDDLFKKNQARYDKRIAKTKKWWHEYSDNHEATKIKKLKDELALLNTELLKYETESTVTTEPEVSTEVTETTVTTEATETSESN
jgi:hypothetical protein